MYFSTKRGLTPEERATLASCHRPVKAQSLGRWGMVASARCDFDLSTFPSIRTWLRRVEQVPGFVAMDWGLLVERI